MMMLCLFELCNTKSTLNKLSSNIVLSFNQKSLFDHHTKMDKMKLVYWDVHGLVEPIRLLLRYTETPFEDVRLQFGEGSSVAALKEPFRKNKHTLKLPFPNLPILEHGQFRLTQVK